MTSVTAENVVIDFPVYGVHRSFRVEIKSMLARTGGLIGRDVHHHRRITVRALNDVSFHLDHGDRLGIVGHNGSGKSTLLRAIAGVYEPVAGRILVEGRISPLFNTVPGLDMDDTGYENIINCGLYLGLTREEIDRKTPDMEQFAELGNYLSLPVRTYSSGMMVRLGFAIATSIEPEILLLDEGIGAGDARFADRAAKRVDALIERASILVIASHAESWIRRFCNKALLLHGGQVVDFGPVDRVMAHMKELNENTGAGSQTAAGVIQLPETVG